MMSFIQENIGNIVVGLIVLIAVALASYKVFVKKNANDSCQISKGEGCGSCTKCG